jgi:hypothetical protein
VNSILKYMMNGKIFLIIITITVGAVFYLSTLKRKVNITGFAFKDDSITVTINGSRYPIELPEGSVNGANYLYEELQYRSFKDSDLIHIKLDSGKFVLIDTMTVLNKAVIQPRVFFEDPSLTEGLRQVLLVSVSGFVRY